MTQKNRHLRTIAQLCRFVITTKACIDNRKKHLLNSNTSSTCRHNMVNFGPLTAEIGQGVLGHPSKFQWVSRLAFITAATLRTRSKPYFARCLAVSWAGTLYIHFRGLLPLTEFCPVQSSLYVQVLHSLLLAALLHSTPAAGVSQTLRCRTRNGITELTQRAPPIFGRADITLGISPHSSFCLITAANAIQ